MTVSVSGEFDDAAAYALRDILSDPATHVPTILADHPGVNGRRISALREAHDYIIGRKLGASATRSPGDAARLIGRLAGVDQALASTLYWHSVLAPFLASIPSSRARNAVLGNVKRGHLLTWASAVPSWTWRSGSAPDATRPVGKADALIEADTYPGLYDAILLWESRSAVLVIVPTYRAADWIPADAAGRWSVRLDGASLHADDVIPLSADPRALALWPGDAQK
jgi:hypothetical protein